MAGPVETTGTAARDTTRAILLFTVSISLFPINDAIAKLLTADYPVAQVVWARYLVHLTVITLLMLSQADTRRRFGTRRPGVQILRGTCMAVGAYAFVFALSHISVVDALAILFLTPLIMVVLSIPVLGEQVGLHRWGAVVVGFLGVLIVMRPGLGVMHWAGSLALVAAFASALQQVLGRKLGATDHPMTSVFYTGLIGFIVASAVVPFDWHPPSGNFWPLVVVLGVIGAIAHFGVIKALAMAPASLLSPFNYPQIFSGALTGYLLFGHLPDFWSMIGIAVIMASGLYVYHRERLLSRRVAVGT
ncbi:MAG: DMT family transporter [Rhodospirillaceae bacterium]|jgi:drug/metabolite transporter (DMT)-like permease|nr:DMT family transporter [Rhodospirillaceae bacterium]